MDETDYDINDLWWQSLTNEQKEEVLRLVGLTPEDINHEPL